MLKTLQNSAGVITIFHSSTHPATRLLRTLELEANPTSPPDQPAIAAKTRSLWNWISKGKNEDPGQPKYTIEELKDQLPTYDQLKIIRSFVTEKPSLIKTFQHSFPQFVSEDFKKVKIPEELGAIELRNEGYQQWVKDGLFVPPLVVDWDKKSIANGEKSLQLLLREYDTHVQDETK